MLRIWAKIMNGSRMEQDLVAENDALKENINLRLDDCMNCICRELDLPKPIWLDSNYDDLNRYGKTVFRQDHFIELIPFSYLEIEIIEMDDGDQ